MSVVQKQFFFDQQKLKNMFSVMRLTFNAVELRVVAINEKLLSRVKEVCRALEHKKAARRVFRQHYRSQNYGYKW